MSQLIALSHFTSQRSTRLSRNLRGGEDPGEEGEEDEGGVEDQANASESDHGGRERGLCCW